MSLYTQEVAEALGNGLTHAGQMDSPYRDRDGKPITYGELNEAMAKADVWLTGWSVPGCTWCGKLIAHYCD